MAEPRIVHCRLLKQDLPGLDKPPFRTELGAKLFEEVSKQAWQQWLKDSVKFVNTKGWDLASSAGQHAWMDQCAIYFGYKEGDLMQTAWTPPKEPEPKP